MNKGIASLLTTVSALALGAAVSAPAAWATAGAATPQPHAPQLPSTAAGLTGVGAPRAQTDKPCFDRARQVPGQGLSCRVEGGLYRVALRNGHVTYTHGADEVHHPAASGQTGNIVNAPRNPVCAAANPHGNYAARAIIAIPVDGTQTISTDGLRGMVRTMDGVIYDAAVESGSPSGADLVFDCDAAGNIAVDVVRLATGTAAANFSTITNELMNAGYQSSSHKYVVYYTAHLASNPNYGGQGSLLSDDSDGASNASNGGRAEYAIDYGYTSVETMLHELGHNLGAVQPWSPYSTGTGGHCWEGQDVMCYNDGGSRDTGYISTHCTDKDHFDCDHDDYFDAKIGAGQGGAAGSYIDTHWNIGDCYANFVVNHGCYGGADTTPPSVSAPAQTGLYLGQTSGANVPVKFVWSGSDASGIAQYLVQLNINGTWYQQTLSAATATSVAWQLTPGSTYQLAVAAKDGAGNWSGYSYGPRFTLDSFQETAPAITYSTGWTRLYDGNLFGGGEKSSTTQYATATVRFTGRGFAWVATRATNRGQAWVYVDGTYIGVVNTYATSTSYRSLVLTRNWSTSAAHTVTVKVVATSGHPQVDVDAFVALR